jgi:hypothetical protein
MLWNSSIPELDSIVSAAEMLAPRDDRFWQRPPTCPGWSWWQLVGTASYAGFLFHSAAQAR